VKIVNIMNKETTLNALNVVKIMIL